VISKPRLLLLATGLTLAGVSLPGHAAWDEKFYNPKPLPDDVILPMPCDGAMVFRKVEIPLGKPLEDYSITLGQDGDEWGYIQQARAEHIAGSFAEGKNGKSRYYLMAKYELTELQYQALMGSQCPTPDNKMRLPKVNIGWVEATNLADKYNLWLRKEKPDALPSEDGAKGFLRLPTETEWEFAARGGLAVSPAEFQDQKFPMPEGISSYAWFAGTQSSNGKLQLAGLLKPNPLGLHDMLGNASEMTFEPFRLNKLDRQHGQAGGYVVRGGTFLTPQGDLRSALRAEEPYYTNTGPNENKTIGLRLAMVTPTLTSRDRIKEIEQEWKGLGTDKGKTKAADNSLTSLNTLSSQVQDEALKKQLEKLRAEMRANSQMRDEQRDQAVRSSLQLGAFLCTKLKDDGEFYDRLNALYVKNCKAGGQVDANCSRRQEQLDEHQKALDFIVSYYADTVVDNGMTYSVDQIKPQVSVVQQQMAARGKTNLNNYLSTYWLNLQGYWKDGKVSRNDWLEACKKTQ